MSFMMMNCFCGMVDQWKGLTLFPAGPIVRDSHHHESDTPQVGFEPALNLSSGFDKWSCTVLITTAPSHQYSECVCFKSNFSVSQINRLDTMELYFCQSYSCVLLFKAIAFFNFYLQLTIYFITFTFHI